MTDQKPQPSEEQFTYAKVLNIGMCIGFIALVLSFALYISGTITSFVPIEEFPKYWGMKAKDYVHTLNAPTGWGWLKMMHKGDYLNFVGIAFLSGLTIACYLAILPSFTREKNIPYVIIGILEIAVLVLAASGILKAGGH